MDPSGDEPTTKMLTGLFSSGSATLPRSPSGMPATAAIPSSVPSSGISPPDVFEGLLADLTACQNPVPAVGSSGEHRLSGPFGCLSVACPRP